MCPRRIQRVITPRKKKGKKEKLRKQQKAPHINYGKRTTWELPIYVLKISPFTRKEGSYKLQWA